MAADEQARRAEGQRNRMRFGHTSGCLCAVLLSTVFSVRAQDTLEFDAEEFGKVVESAQEWAKENLDEEMLKTLPEVDRQEIEKFLKQFQQQLKGDYVLDLAVLKDAAKAVLPLLDAREETKPYATWLRSRLDYFEVAEELRKNQPPPKLVPGQPPKPAPLPSPAEKSKVWQQQLSQRDWPKGAAELVPQLKPIFTAERVPEQLVWVAEVESGFNPEARSPVGAAGLFQIMPATAQRFGLRRWPRDQRYQPEPSARAAAQYLRYLYHQFGDWRLAMAAYNAGEGRIQRLLERHRTRSFDRIAPHLPAETQLFVPKVEATLLRREGVELARLKGTER